MMRTQETLKWIKGSDLAEVLGLTVQRIGQLAKDEVIVARSQMDDEGHMSRQYDLASSVQGYIKYMMTASSKDPKAEKREQEKAEAEIKYKKAKARKAELEVGELEGKMHRSEDVELVVGDLISMMRGQLMALPGRLASRVVKLESVAKVIQVIQSEVYDTMNRLADYQYSAEAYAELVRSREGWNYDNGIEKE